MNAKKLVIGGLVGGIALFLLGWLIYGMLLMDFMNQQHGLPAPIGVNRQEPLLLYVLFGNLVGGVFIAYIFLKTNTTTLAGGIFLGAVMGLLISASMDTLMYGLTHLLSRKGVLIDVAASTVLWGLGGAVVGFVLSKVKD
ncbi:hypothetical protein ACQ33O_08890 [Ferruginibacter sp. SUN002]|uniref:hypothetical protein n=1 Tax=Ferruginibacter sp. SUN002 TaxID=2937789 RepID=UPI003D35FFC8